MQNHMNQLGIGRRLRAHAGRNILLAAAAVALACSSDSKTNPPPPAATMTSIAITPASPTIGKGATQQFAVTGTYSDQTTKAITSGITWSSSNTAVATVSASGVATGVSAGSATITAAVGTVSSTAALTVLPPTLTSIALSQASATIATGGQLTLTVTGTFSDGSTAPVTTGLTWSSSNTAAATVDQAGKITGVAGGNATVSASVGGLSAQCLLTVTPPTAVHLTSIAITPAAPSKVLGTTQQFAATGTFSDSSTAPLPNASWSSSSTGVATISASGLATPVAVGTTTITATFADPGGAGNVSGTTTLTVLPVPLVSIAVTPATVTVAAGFPVNTLVATGTFQDASTAVLTTGITWTSSNTAVATVDPLTGAVATLTPGTVTITATATGTAISGTATITVGPHVLQTITVTPRAPSVPVNFFQQFTATGLFSDATTQDLTAQAVWTSSDTASATIDATGRALGVAVTAAGAPVIITATFSGISATATLDVTPAPFILEVPAVPIDSALDATGSARFHIPILDPNNAPGGLNPAVEYLVTIAPAATSVDPNINIQVFSDPNFLVPVCSTTAVVLPACRVGFPPAPNGFFVLVTGTPGNFFTLDAPPMPVLVSGAATPGAVGGSETYFKLAGLTPGSLFEATLTGLTDDADLVVYNGPNGAQGGAVPVLCESRFGVNHPERCVGTVPASGTLYVTVEGWLTIAGSPFVLTVGPATPLPIAHVVAFPANFTDSVGNGVNNYQITGVTAGQGVTVTLTGLQADADLYVYADSTFGTLLCFSNNPLSANESCLATATGTSLFVQVDGFFVGAGNTTPLVLGAQ